MSNLHHDTSEMNVLFVHSAVDDYPLTPEEFRVYAHLARRAGIGEAWPKVESIARVCRMHPDTARRCLHALIAYGMIKAKERKGRTNLYTITKFSSWKPAAQVEAIQKAATEAGKAKRAAKKAVKPLDAQQIVSAALSEEKQAYPSETKGGLVNGGRPGERREATPSEWREGYPSETKGDEVNPFEVHPLKEGVITLEEDARATPPAARPEIQARQDAQAPSSSSENASLQTSTATQQASDDRGPAGTTSGFADGR